PTTLRCGPTGSTSGRLTDTRRGYDALGKQAALALERERSCHRNATTYEGHRRVLGRSQDVAPAAAAGVREPPPRAAGRHGGARASSRVPDAAVPQGHGRRRPD